MAKCFLKWDEFEANISESFRKLREEERLFDVTLATDGGQQIQAHKMVLMAGSHFFRDIFMNTNHGNMLIYLKGISSTDLDHITDFMYNGEACIAQEELKQFLQTCKELKVKGLQGDIQKINQDVPYEQNSDQVSDQIETEKKYSEIEPVVVQENVLDLAEALVESIDAWDHDIARMGGKGISPNKNMLLDNQIEQMIENNEGLWSCKVCSKTVKKKGNIKHHAETHIEGLLHSCPTCSRAFSSRFSMQVHVSRIHSQLFSCDVCEKSGMNKATYSRHNKVHHKT